MVNLINGDSTTPQAKVDSVPATIKVEEDVKSLTPKINLDLVKNEAGALRANFNCIQHSKILENLLKEFGPVDYRARAKLDEEAAKLLPKHIQVISIEEILNVARKNNFGLCLFNHDLYTFNGAYWKKLDNDKFQVFLSKAAIKMGVDEFDAKHHNYKNSLYKQFLSSAILDVPEKESNEVQVNFQNGTFDIFPENQTLRGFDRNDFLTYQLPFKFDPNAAAPIFKKYLERVLPDESSQKVLAEFIGYIFMKTSFLKLEKALILYGSGANGKSVLFEILMALLGKENVSNYNLESLTDNQGYQRAKIGDVRLNYSSEITNKLRTDIFKQIVSGEPIDARLPYKEPFILYDYAKLMFNCNNLPKDVEQTNAFFRRFLIVPFDVTIPEKEQDPELAKKIINSELAGVFNWVLEGLKRVIKQKKFTPCKASQLALRQYRIDSDSVKTFLYEENYLHSNETFIYQKEIYDKYKAFCSLGGFKPCSTRTLSERLEDLNVHIVRRKNGKIFWIEKKPCLEGALVAPKTPIKMVVDELGEASEAKN